MNTFSGKWLIIRIDRIVHSILLIMIKLVLK
jgi:hypothetical protein